MRTDKQFQESIKGAGSVLSKADQETFIPMKVWPLLSKGVKNKIFILLKRKPLLETPIETNIEESFPLEGTGYVHYLYTSSIHFGYAIEIAKNKVVECRTTFINTQMGKNLKGFEIQHVLNLNGFSVYRTGSEFLIGNSRSDLVNHLL